MTDYLVSTGGKVWRETADNPRLAAIQAVMANRFSSIGVLIEVVPVEATNPDAEAVYMSGLDIFQSAGHRLEPEAK